METESLLPILLWLLSNELLKLAPRNTNREFYLYMRVLLQTKNSKHKIYSLHEPHAYAVGKGKDHKKWEYGTKASFVTTKKSGIIIGVASHEKNEHDSKTLEAALSNRVKPISEAICDRG